MGIKTKFMKSYSLRGEWTEARFMIRACEHGFNVSRPSGGSSRYDFAVELNGQFLRVQVKSTTWKKDGVAYVFALCGATRRRYTEEEIDFFAVYVIPEDAWYIIPARVVVRLKSSLRLYPHSTSNRKHKYECYFEAWHLLKSANQKPSPLHRQDASRPGPVLKVCPLSERAELRPAIRPAKLKHPGSSST